MPIEFTQDSQPTGSSGGNLFRLTMAYDGSGRRISKTRWVKSANSQNWEKELVTHYTGIGTEIRESFTGSRFARRTQRTACKSIAEPKNLGAKRNEHDDEIALNYFGACYLDPKLGMWISVDAKRQYPNPYLYAGDNPIMRVDSDVNFDMQPSASSSTTDGY